MDDQASETRGEAKPWLGPAFEPFADWLKDGPAGKWPRLHENLSDDQKRIVAANARLLLDRKAWHQHIDAFEAAISSLPEDGRPAARAAFEIRLDEHDFGPGGKDFRHFRFPCAVSFTDVRFNAGGVSFEGATFVGAAKFAKAQFGEGVVSFYKTGFGGIANFVSASFGKGTVTFTDASFGGKMFLVSGSIFDCENVWMVRTRFPTCQVEASDIIVKGNLHVAAEFGESADFGGLQVEGTASFAGSRFAQVPNFLYAKFDRPPEVAGMLVPPPKLGKAPALQGDGVAGFFRICEAEGDVARYRKLKTMALAANDHEKDGEFFAYEMMAKRGTETTSSLGLLFNTAYWWLSDFGQSYVRPILWWIGSFVFFAFLNAALIIFAHKTTSFLPLRADMLTFSVALSGQNSLPLFGSLFQFASKPNHYTGWFQTYFDVLSVLHPSTAGWLIGLGIAQNILGGVLLFLFLLALRNRFRLK